MDTESIVSTWPAFTTVSGSEYRENTSSIALDFLVSVATAGVRIHSSTAALGIEKLEDLTVGLEGSAQVQRGQTVGVLDCSDTDSLSRDCTR